ncbi:14157_t:CDS:2, partial [Cetraspora pellucida]
MPDPWTMTIFSDLNTTSPERMFHLKFVDIRNVQFEQIFIGFPTHQTNGCSSYMAARLIPTVEYEMSQLYKVYREIVGSNAKTDEATNSAMSGLKNELRMHFRNFTFKHSTPNSHVGQIIEFQILNYASQPLSIISIPEVQPQVGSNPSQNNYPVKLTPRTKNMQFSCRKCFNCDPNYIRPMFSSRKSDHLQSTSAPFAIYSDIRNGYINIVDFTPIHFFIRSRIVYNGNCEVTIMAKFQVID